MSTNRLIDLFMRLADGPAGITELQILMKEKHASMTITALRKTLHTCRKDGLIVSRLYTNPERSGCSAIYALTEAGAEMLCREVELNIESIRMQLPAKHYVSHDTHVTKVVRALRREADRFGFEIHMADEYYLRIPLKGFPKKRPLPDLYLQYRLNKDAKALDVFNIEIDNNTTPARRLFSKVVGLPHRTLILSPSERRIDNLTSSFKHMSLFLEQSQARHANKTTPCVQEKLYFARIEDFCHPDSGGVYRTVWKKIELIATMISFDNFKTRGNSDPE